MATFETRGWDDVDFETRGWDEVEPPEDPFKRKFSPETDAADAIAQAEIAKRLAARGLPEPTRPGPTVEAGDKLIVERAARNEPRKKGLVDSVNRNVDRAIEDSDHSLGATQLASGVATAVTGIEGTGARARARLLAEMDLIDEGGKVEILAGDKLLQEYKHGSEEVRAEIRDRLTGKIREAAQTIKEARGAQGLMRRNEASAKMSAELDSGQWADAWNTFRSDPLGIVQQFSLESAPMSAPSAVGGIVGGAMGGLPGFLMGIASGTFPVEYVSAFNDAIEEAGIDASKPEQVERALRSDQFVNRAGELALLRGASMTAVEAATAKLMLPLVRGKGAAQNIGRAGLNVLNEQINEPAGEAISRVVAGQELTPSEIVGELLGAGPQAAASTIGRTAAERRNIQAPERILSSTLDSASFAPVTISPSQAPVTFESIAAPILAKKSNDTVEDIDASIRQAEAAIFGEAPTTDTAIAEGLIASALPGVETPQTPYGQPPELPVPPLVPDRGYDTGRGELDPDKVLATELQTPGAPESPQAPVVPPEPGTVAPMAGAASMESRQLAAEEKRQRGELLTGVEREQAAEFRARPAPEIQTPKATVEIGQIPHDLDAPFPQLVAKLRSARKAETVAQIQSVISERYGISPEEIPRRGPLPTELMARAAKIALKEPQAPYQTGVEAAKAPATPDSGPKMAPPASIQPRQGTIDTAAVSVPQPPAKAAPVAREPAALDEEGVGYLQERRGAEERATSMQVEREARKVDEKGQFAKGERQAVRAFAEEAGANADEVEAEVRRQKARHPPSAGWAPLVATGLDPEKSVADGVKYRIVPWTFHKPPKGVPKAAHVDRLSSSMLREVKKTIAMARAGNENAKAIVDQMHWYTGFNKNLRSRFGGFGEMFADIIGATSPLQNVTENYKSAKAAAARFLNGDYDVELRKLEKHLAQGKSSNDFPARDKIRTLTGELFGVNSAAAMKAMLGIWQEVKKGTSPKTRNFAKNLLGTSTAATIDSWAARTLQRLAGQPRIPPMAEGGVRGTHLTDPSQVGSSFGFGQEVFEKTAQKLRDAGVDITAADLQAMMWFSEKALWTKNNWTTKAGEGGSLEAEMAKDETDRYQGLVSAQQGEVEPTEEAVRGVIGSLKNILSGDSRVLMHREIPTIGGYMDGTEQALDVEIVADQEWDPMPTFSAMVEEAKKNKQDSVGLSRVIRPGEQNANSRPGVEVYLKKDAEKSDVLAISKALRDTGAGGFTLAVDARARRGDPATPGDKFIGIRVQYVPEVFIRAYHQGWATGEQADKDYADLTSGDEARVQAVMERAESALFATLADLRSSPAVAHAEGYHYDTLLVGKEDYDSYGTREAGELGEEGAGDAWPGSSAGERLRETARRHAEAIGVDPRSLGGERVGDEAAAESGAGEGNRPPDGPAQGGLNVQEPRDGYEVLPEGRQEGRRSAKSPVRRGSGRVPGGYRMRALGIERHLVQAGATALVGKQVKTAADLADLAQVYRNPHYETFRFFFVDKKGEIVHAGAVSARLPGQTGVFPSELGTDEGYDWIRSQMPPEATGYYILHNHPSGIPTPSDEDLDLTRVIHSRVKGFKGHVVIDHNKYAVIDKEGDFNITSKDLGAKNFFVKESQGPLGSVLDSPGSVAQLGFGLRNGNFLTMIGSSNRGVQAIADITPEEINHPMRGPAAIRRFARAAGTSAVFIAGERKLVEKIRAASTRLVESGFLTDVVGYTEDGHFRSERMAGTSPSTFFGNTRTSVVREQSFPIPEVSPATPVVSLRPQKPNASTAVGINYGKSERTELDGNAYGKGAPGAEMSRIEMEEDAAKRARLMNRVYFYAQTGNSLPKSEGVVYGSHVRRAKLTNLYNFTLDPEGLVKKAAGDRNAAELNIVDAGYDGYLVTTAYPSPAIVLVDAPKKVRVEYMGFRAKAQESLGKVKETGPLYDTGPLWYSKLAKLIAETKTETMPAKQWAAYIDNLKSKGAKQDEIQWSGVKEWLDMQGAKVTKAQILEYLNANGVKVEEVELGDDAGNDDARNPASVRETDDGDWEVVNEDTGYFIDGTFESQEDAQEAADRWWEEEERFGSAAPRVAATKFAQYQLPGGKNYRELLLTLPPRMSGADVKQLPDGSWRVVSEGGSASFGATREEAIKRFAGQQGGISTFRSSHFDTPNILAHVRFNERTDADGKRILFIEEIQSDWAQKGKKEGFVAKPIENKYRLSGGFAGTEVRNAAGRPTGEYYWSIVDGGEQVGMVIARTEEEARRRVDEQHPQAVGRTGKTYTGVPAAPFVGKTEAWVGLALKRMVRYAADNGFDGIAWTSGSQQESRYWDHELVRPAVRKWNEISKPQSPREQVLEHFGRELAPVVPLEVVDVAVLPALKNDQVARAVVEAIPVDVVNILSDNGFSPNELVSKPDVVGDALPVDARPAVARGLARATQLVGARLRAALLRVLSPETSRGDEEVLPAVRASDLGSREVWGLLSSRPLGGSASGEASGVLSGPRSSPASAGAESSVGSLALTGKRPELGTTELALLLNRHGDIVARRTGNAVEYVQPPPGEGMRAFYDRIVPNVAKEVLKSVGGGRVSLIDAGPVRETYWMSGEEAMKAMGKPESWWDEATQVERDALIEEARSKNIVTKESQPGFYLTPEMKAKASQGMAMFEPREDYKVAEPNDDYSLDFTGEPKGLADIMGQLSKSGGAMKERSGPDEFKSTRRMTRAYDVLKALSDDPGTFQFGDSQRRDLAGIASDMGLDNIISIRPIDGGKIFEIEMNDTKAVPFEYEDADGETVKDVEIRQVKAYIKTGEDKLTESTADEDTAWVDVSQLTPGKGGKEVYQLAMTWAARNGYVFKSDPLGVSPKAFEGRVSNMLSAAMRLGTTKFMWPTAPEDAKAYPEWRVPKWARDLDAEWKHVDEIGGEEDQHNQRLLIRTFLDLTEAKLKGKGLDNFKGIRYDFVEENFYDENGEPADLGTLAAISRALLPVGSKIPASGARGAQSGTRVRDGGGQGVSDLSQNAPDLGVGAASTAARAIVLRSALDLSHADVERLAKRLRRENRSASGTPRGRILNESKPPYWVTSGSPELQAAAAKIDTYVPEKPFAEKLADLRGIWKETLTQKVFDAYAPLKKLGRKEYVLARMAKASGGALEGTLLYGKPKMDDDGAIYGELDKKGFLGFMSELKGEHDRFLMWVAGNRAERLMKEGRENLFKPEEIAAMKELVAGKMKDGASRPQAYAKAAAALREYNKAVLDVAEKSGLIDAESRKIWEHDFYVPFFRMNEELSLDGPAKVKGLVRQQAFKKLKGGEENLGDLLQNILHNWDHLLAASMANNAARANLKAAEKLGIAVESTETATKDMAKSVGFSKGATFVMDEGTPHWYFVDDPFVLEAVSAINAPQLNWLGVKTMGKFKHWLTLGVTVSPTFRIRNLIRDSLSAVAQNEVSFNLLKNVAQGAQAMDTKSEEYAQNLFSGALIRFGYLTDGKHAEHAKRLIESGVPDKTILDTPTKIKDAAGAMWDYWQEVGDRAENVNRAAIARQSRKRGQSRLEAAYQARDLLDFSLQGSWVAIRFLTQVVPFLNARLQGLYKLGRSGYDNPARLGAVAGAVALASIALLLAYKDDDDWKAREDWDRDNYWWFKIGGVAYRIPKPFEVGAIGTIAERSLEAMVSDEMNGKRLAERLRSMLMDTFALNPVPQIVKPPIDLYANKDSFSGRQIETRGMENLSKPERASGGTSGVAKILGKAGNVTGLSPVQIDHLIRGYFGWLGTHVVMGVDQLARPFMEQTKPASKLGDMFVVGDFAKDLPARSSRYLEDFYKDAKKVHETMGDIRKAREAGQMEKVKEILQDRGDDVRLSGLYSSAEQRISETRRRMRIIEASKMEPELKRQRLDELTQQINAIAKVTSRRSTEVRAR